MHPPRDEDVQHVLVRVRKAVGHMWDMPFSHSNMRQRRKALRALVRRLDHELTKQPEDE